MDEHNKDQDIQNSEEKKLSENEIDNSTESEIELENNSSDNFGSDPEEIIKKLKEKLKQANKEKQEYLNGWQRTKAEFVNAKKRLEDDLKEYKKFAEQNLIEELLPVMQSFDMAMSNKEAWEKVEKNWRIGVEYIFNQLKNTLEKSGLKEINPLGEIFNPERDEAIEHIKTEDESKKGKIIEVVQKGYSLNEKIIRPSKVKIAE